MSIASKTESRWKARFNIHPSGVLVSKTVNLADVTLVTKSDGMNTRVVSIEVVTPASSFVEAMEYSQLMANRCADILSFISRYGVACSLKQINEIDGEDGVPKTGVAPFPIEACIEAPKEVDLTKPAFLRVIREKDEKLARQLSHFRRGLSSSNIIEQIREYFLILEDEYGRDDPRTAKYKYVRHLVNHAELTDPKAKTAAIAMVGKSYFDPSEPNDLSVVSSHLKNIKDEAMHIIESKI